MKQFKALLLKEWHTHRFGFLIPSIVVAAFFLLFALSSIYGRIRFGMPDWSFAAYSDYDSKELIWTLHYVVSVIIAWFAILASITLNDNMLNQDRHRKCEIMHNSQPVSLIKMLGAKLSFSVPLMLLQYLLLAIISSLIISTILAFLGFNAWIIGMSAIFSPFWMVFISMMAASSLFWLFSCIFHKQAVLKLWISLLVIDLLRMILTRLWGDAVIFSPLRYYIKILTLPVSLLKVGSASFNFSWDSISSTPNMISLAVSILMYIVGYYVYKQRELS